MKKWLVLLLILLCTSCSQTWVRQGTTRSQFQRDWAECDYYARSHCSVNGFLGLELRNKCMKMKGYHLERR